MIEIIPLTVALILHINYFHAHVSNYIYAFKTGQVFERDERKRHNKRK